mmetsp:Transcript_7249/g.10247  ORF Transcript_7249/g.10247 Transcript_7249/m.10247 type:complete len:92 (+) Transcript_7249:141-416(+)
MSDLATQISALLGTSMLLFFVTAPRQKSSMTSSISSSSIGSNETASNNTLPEVPSSPRQRLIGMKRYSSHHRRKYYKIASTVGRSSTVSLS